MKSFWYNYSLKCGNGCYVEQKGETGLGCGSQSFSKHFNYLSQPPTSVRGCWPEGKCIVVTCKITRKLVRDWLGRLFQLCAVCCTLQLCDLLYLDDWIHKKTCRAQWKSHQRDTDQTPCKHPPQIWQLSGIGKQEENKWSCTDFKSNWELNGTTRVANYVLVLLPWCCQVVPKSQKCFSLPAGKSLDSKYVPRRPRYSGKDL